MPMRHYARIVPGDQPAVTPEICAERISAMRRTGFRGGRPMLG